MEPKFSAFFLPKLRTQFSFFFVIYVINLEPIEVQTHSAAQNDRLNLSFVKDIHVVAKKITRNGRKMAIFET